MTKNHYNKCSDPFRFTFESNLTTRFALTQFMFFSNVQHTTSTVSLWYIRLPSFSVVIDQLSEANCEDDIRREFIPMPFIRRLRYHLDSCTSTNMTQYSMGGLGLLSAAGRVDVVHDLYMVPGHKHLGRIFFPFLLLVSKINEIHSIMQC